MNAEPLLLSPASELVTAACGKRHVKLGIPKTLDQAKTRCIETAWYSVEE
jgi:hypothetical protein